MALIDIAGLQAGATKYDEELRYLPWLVLEEQLQSEYVSMIQVANRHERITSERKGGLAQPYAAGSTVASTESGRFVPSILQVETGVVIAVDNITNYNNVRFGMNPQEGTGYNQTKTSPAEDIILGDVVKTNSEDIYDALYAGERDVTDHTPTGLFDGFGKKITDAITDTTISVANGNLIAIGNIVAPVNNTDTDAIDKIIQFVRGADRSLRRYNAVLRMTRDVYDFAVDALENKQSSKGADTNELQEYINRKAKSKITVVVSDAYGTGSQIHLTTEDNFELGFDTFGDTQFVQVRNVDPDDANVVQYWIQFRAGVRINSFNKKVFAVSDGAVAYEAVSGDY